MVTPRLTESEQVPSSYPREKGVLFISNRPKQHIYICFLIRKDPTFGIFTKEPPSAPNVPLSALLN